MPMEMDKYLELKEQFEADRDDANAVKMAAYMLAPGGISHSGPGGNRQFWPGENSQS